MSAIGRNLDRSPLRHSWPNMSASNKRCCCWSVGRRQGRRRGSLKLTERASNPSNLGLTKERTGSPGHPAGADRRRRTLVGSFHGVGSAHKTGTVTAVIDGADSYRKELLARLATDFAHSSCRSAAIRPRVGMLVTSEFWLPESDIQESKISTARAASPQTIGFKGASAKPAPWKRANHEPAFPVSF